MTFQVLGTAQVASTDAPIAHHIVPEVQPRGIVREKYEFATLGGDYGLPPFRHRTSHAAATV
jgi:hypothetical protein